MKSVTNRLTDILSSAEAWWKQQTEQKLTGVWLIISFLQPTNIKQKGHRIIKPLNSTTFILFTIQLEHNFDP